MKLLVALLLAVMAAHPRSGSGQTTADGYFACFDFASLVEGGSVDPHWIDDGPQFWYAVSDGDTLVHKLVDPLAGTVAVTTAAELEIENEEAVPPPSSDALVSGDGRFTATIVDHDVWIATTGGGTSQATFGGNQEIPWSLDGASWSPDSRFLAVIRFDGTAVPTIPIVDWLDPGAEVERVPYTQSCEPRGETELAVIEPDAGEFALASLDDVAEPLLWPLGWIEASNELLALRFDRPMHNKELLAIAPQSGLSRVVVQETSETFVDGLAAAFLLGEYYRPLADGKRFIWLGERDGFHHLSLFNHDGKLECRLTEGDWPVEKVQFVDEDAGWVYFTAKCDPSDPTSRQLCRVSLDGSKFSQLTTAPGRRTVHFSPDGNWIIDNHSDLDRAPRSDLLRADGTLVRTLENADISALEDLGWTVPQRITVKAADGIADCHCAIYLPPGFDPDLRYPVIEVIYAGPQWMIVPRRFVAGEYGDTATALAQLGYVAVIVDSPGTAGVGKSYQDVVFGRLGQIEIPDHVAAIKNLGATRPWLDLDRVGVHGKSWGGYFALRAMLLAPDFYKVGVASAAVVDLATTAESPVVPYLGLPAENPAGYAAADCLPLADRFQGELLMTIGTSDRNTPFGQTMRMLRAFSEAGKDVEVLVLPGEHHWLQGASFARWQRALRDFFLEHLPPAAG